MAYITVQDVRDAGVTVAMASDAQVNASILMNQQFIERSCRQWFEPRTITAFVDGNSSDTLHLFVPIISVASMRINDNTNDLDPTQYKVYNGRDFPDDRHNPRIKLVRGNTDIFANPFGGERPFVFRKGRQNQRIEGVFGYTEPDGSTPELIQRALLVLVIEKLANPLVGDPVVDLPPGPTGNILRETTDGHTVQYTFVKFGDTRAGFSGYTMNREVLTILNMYKGPIGVKVASARWIES